MAALAASSPRVPVPRNSAAVLFREVGEKIVNNNLLGRGDDNKKRREKRAKATTRPEFQSFERVVMERPGENEQPNLLLTDLPIFNVTTSPEFWRISIDSDSNLP